MTGWKLRAACNGHAPQFDADIEGETGAEHRERVTGAMQLCGTCPVRDDCAVTALTEPVEGVWAGHYHHRLDSQRKTERRRTAA